jgi:hypothetical protein
MVLDGVARWTKMVKAGDGAASLGKRGELGGKSAAAFFCNFDSVRGSNALSSNPITHARLVQLLITQERPAISGDCLR